MRQQEQTTYLFRNLLLNLGLVAAPTKAATVINNSGLTLLKSRLLGYAEKVWDKKYYLIGSEVHKRVLEPKKKPKRFPREEELLIRGMVEVLLANPIMQSLLKDSIKEKKLKGKVMGAKMHGTLDINKKKQRRIADIKTTSGKTLADCIKSCINYGYFRQAIVYLALADADEFIFIFVTKSKPHKLFFVNVKDYPKEMEEARRELAFLLLFYNTVGMLNPIKRESKIEDSSGRVAEHKAKLKGTRRDRLRNKGPKIARVSSGILVKAKVHR